MFITAGCSLPIGNSLLVNEGSNCSIVGCTAAPVTGSGALDIQAISKAVSVKIDETDSVEITGSCQDNGKKNNRILVEAFAAEDESAVPYFSNAISDYCYSSTNPIRSGLDSVFINPKAVVMGLSQSTTFTVSGGVAPYTYTMVAGAGSINAGGVYSSPASNTSAIIQVSDGNGEVSRATISALGGISTTVVTNDNKKCFSVTKGIGRVEDAGLPNERTYPQCHNGQFGFRVRLGKVLLNPAAGQPNYKYHIRFKLRTQEGTIADSPWDTVNVDRILSAPLVDSVTFVPATHKCTIKSSPARFNLGIFYTLNRTYTDILATGAGAVNVYAGANTSVTTTGNSVFEWDDINRVDGVTYNYTLTSTDLNFGYNPTLPVAAAAVVTCDSRRPSVIPTSLPTATTCYLGLDAGGTSPTTPNPGVTYEWGYTFSPVGNSSWIGSGNQDGKTNSGYVSAACGNTTFCTENGLTTGTTYFFAVRARNLATGEIGKWSFPAACKPN